MKPTPSSCSRFATVVASVFMLLAAVNLLQAAEPVLKDAFRGHFLIGTAVGDAQINGRMPDRAALIARHFNALTPENVMKWEALQPEPGRFDFAAADRCVEFAERHGMAVIGHTLVWHSQTPAWVFRGEDGGPATREQLLARMSNHIHQVVGRYRGRVRGWDVVNEALNEDGTLRQSPWLRIIGEDYLAKAFVFAHAADPAAQLYYNDYSLENPAKRAGAVRLVKNLQAAGAPIHGIGTQMHVKMDWPSPAQVDETLKAFGELGIKVMVTELDVDVLPTRSRDRGADVSLRLAAAPALNPYTNGLPAEVQTALARRYAELFEVFLKHRAVLDRVTLWGSSDGESWLNNWPIRGRTAHPLLFDRAGAPKPAFYAVIETAARLATPSASAP